MLRCAGELVVAFTDNSLIDIPGPDLYVFEVGPDVEPTALAVSEDSRQWIRVGRISGGKVEVDLSPYIEPEAHTALEDVIDSIPDPARTRIEVAGHTDSVGSEQTNQTLSENRARAVAGYLTESGNFGAEAVTIRAFGESRPVASNETSEGWARNRRVELTARTVSTTEAEDEERIEILGVWDASEHGVMELESVNGELRGSYTLDNGALLGEFTAETV